MLRMRIRGPNGVSKMSLRDDATVADLLAEIRSITSLSKFDLKYGYPQKPLILPESDTVLLSSLGKQLKIKFDGEQLTISRKEDSPPPTEPDIPEDSTSSSGNTKESKPISLQSKGMGQDIPEVPMPDRRTTMGNKSV